jgi:putative DNA primase/helicase
VTLWTDSTFLTSSTARRACGEALGTAECRTRTDLKAPTSRKHHILGRALRSGRFYHAGRGWPVLPLHSASGSQCSCGDPSCRSAGKHPRTLHGIKDASTDPEQIRDWWKQWPEANIGIATGARSGLVVFDIDPRNGGRESYDKLQQEFLDALKVISKVRTGSEGFHLYFTFSGPLPSRANVRPGIDVKADGGYVVAPPSVHASNYKYRFTSPNFFRPPPLPQVLHELILKGAQAHAGGNVHSNVDLQSLFVSEEIKNLIRDGKPGGQRSEAIFRAARAMVIAGHSDEEITAVLVDSAHKLSEKPREKGSAWLAAEIKRAREKPSIGSQQPAADGPVLIFRRASDIPAEKICWLWPQRIAVGKICLIAGDPGLGKSQLATHLAAVVSSGGGWCTTETCPAGEVIIFSAEDDPGDTIRPRLEAAGANLDRVHIVDGVKDTKGGERYFNLKLHLEPLAAMLATLPDARLVIIDPISSYLGGINSHNNTDVRSVLAPLAKLAADHGVAVVCITHLNKSESADPLTRIMGSTAFGASVRTAFLVAPDRNPARRLFIPIKSNIAAGCSSLGFRVEKYMLPSGIETSHVAWDGEPVTLTASEALTAPTPEQIAAGKDLAEACLKVFESLNTIELRSSILQERLKADGHIISSKALKEFLGYVGIYLRERSDANYYVKADFQAVCCPTSLISVPASTPSTHAPAANR